jgi:hypothetical protein
MLTGPEIAAASHHRLKGFTNQVTMASARQWAENPGRTCGLDGDKFVGQSWTIMEDGEVEVVGLDDSPYD